MQKSIIYFFCFFVFFTNLYSNEEKKFLMLKNNKVNVRYGPSLDDPIKYIYKKIFFVVNYSSKILFFIN